MTPIRFTMMSILPEWVTDKYSMFRAVVLPTTLIVWGLLTFLLATIYFIQVRTCNERQKIMNINTEYHFWSGCMVDVKGQLLPWSEVVPVERNGKIVFTAKPYVRLAPPTKETK
jgi:hypothetical protein